MTVITPSDTETSITSTRTTQEHLPIVTNDGENDSTSLFSGTLDLMILLLVLIVCITLICITCIIVCYLIYTHKNSKTSNKQLRMESDMASVISSKQNASLNESMKSFSMAEVSFAQLSQMSKKSAELVPQQMIDDQAIGALQLQVFQILLIYQAWKNNKVYQVLQLVVAINIIHMSINLKMTIMIIIQI